MDDKQGKKEPTGFADQPKKKTQAGERAEKIRKDEPFVGFDLPFWPVLLSFLAPLLLISSLSCFLKQSRASAARKS